MQHSLGTHYMYAVNMRYEPSLHARVPGCKYYKKITLVVDCMHDHGTGLRSQLDHGSSLGFHQLRVPSALSVTTLDDTLSLQNPIHTADSGNVQCTSLVHWRTILYLEEFLNTYISDRKSKEVCQ